MKELFIIHKGKRHNVQEPTIRDWSEVMKSADLFDQGELFLAIMEKLTDIPREEITKIDANEIMNAGAVILQNLNEEKKNVYKNITFKEREYKFLDVNNISFGQFIDIDTFLNKEEHYKKQNLNELAAYLYIPKETEYGDDPIAERKELFQDLPMKYLEGAVFFLINSARTSALLTRTYSQSKAVKAMIKTKIILGIIGVGIRQSAAFLRTKYGNLTALLGFPLLCVSITFLTLWTLIRNKKG